MKPAYDIDTSLYSVLCQFVHWHLSKGQFADFKSNPGQ